MIKHMIKMISSALLHSSDQEMQFTQPMILDAYNDYAQGEYFEHIADQHHQDFLQHQSNSQSDPSQVEYRNAMWNFLIAALRGHKEAQYRLGTGYLNGELGLPKNFSLAEFWLKKSADQGYSPANTALQKSYEEIVFS